MTQQTWTYDEIAAYTGLTGIEADYFTSEQQVRDYFTREAMDAMGLGGSDEGEYIAGVENHRLSQDELDAMADLVIANRWDCAF